MVSSRVHVAISLRNTLKVFNPIRVSCLSASNVNSVGFGARMRPLHADRFEEGVVDEIRLVFREVTHTPQISHSRTFGERLDAVYDIVSEPPPFGQNDIFSDHRELSGGYEEQLLEARYSSGAGVGGVRMCRIAPGTKVLSHKAIGCRSLLVCKYGLEMFRCFRLASFFGCIGDLNLIESSNLAA